MQRLHRKILDFTADINNFKKGTNNLITFPFKPVQQKNEGYPTVLF